jgi:hypothetical protein
MKGVLSRIILKDEFLFNGTVEQLEEKLRFQNNQKFRIEWVDYQSFKFLSNFSLGTMMVKFNPGFADGIKGYAQLIETESSKTKVSLRTKIRIELYFFLAVMLIAIIAVLVSEEVFPLWMLWLTPLGLLWFWFVYRMQEQILFSKLKNYLTK